MPIDFPELNDGTPSGAGVREMRVDAAHPVRRASVPQERHVAAHAAAQIAVDEQAARSANDDVELGPFSAEIANLTPAGTSPTFLAKHAADLADRLQLRLAEVDRRESRLNSQEAEFDSRIRNARLWIDQRDAEIAEEQQRLTAWEQQLLERQEAAASQFEEASELEQRLKELAHREKAAAALTIELELGRTEQQTKLDALEFETAACRTRQHELEQAKQRCEQRHRELDGREASLYAQHERASHERLELDAREKEIRSRESTVVVAEARLNECQKQLAEDAGAIEFERAELRQQLAGHQDRAAALAEDQRRLDFRRREIETALERFERLGVVEGRIAEVEELAGALAVRATYLDSAESVLSDREMQLAEQQRELERERLAFQNQINRDRRQVVAEQEASRVQTDQRQRELNLREASLDQRQQALEAIGEQLRATQREALELRLATEETWMQLQGALAPASLARSIAQHRCELTSHFQLASDEVRTRRHELERVRLELSEQLQELQAQRNELQRWAKARDQDVEQRASQLVAREQELDAQQKHFERLEKQWVAQRLEYQREIQRLLAELRCDLKQAA